MIHLEIVGSSASPRAGLLTRMDVMDSRARRVGSPSVMYPPSTPIRRPAGIIRLRSGSRNRRAVKTPQQGHVPLPEPADQDLPQDYIASVHNAIASYNTTPTSSGRSSPTNADTHSTLSVSQGGWTTGNTTERSSLDSSCYSLDEFDRQAASTVNQHFEEFESMLFEGPRETVSNAYRECQEWVTQFPHLRVLGKQVLAPKDTGYNFTPTVSSISTTPRPSTSGTLEFSENDLSFASDTQGLTLSGRKVKATRAPPESTKLSSRDRHHDNSHISGEYDFLHEEIFAQDGVYEDIIAVDYKNIYEDNMEHKKQITPRRRRVGYPPITPNACVKDSVLSAAFDTMWFEIMSWMRLLMKKYAAEVEAKKGLGALDHSGMIRAPPRTSSFIYEQARSSHPINDILKVSTMPLVNRTNGPGPTDMPDSMVLMNPPGLWRTNPSRPPTVNPLRWRPGHGRSLDPLLERSKVQNSDESRSHQPSPQHALRVKQIMPTGVATHHRLSSPPNPMAGRLPPLEPSAAILSSHRKFGNRASSAIDNKEGRNLAGREKSNNAVEFSRPSTTQAFRSETPYNLNRRSSTPLGQNRGVTYLMSGQSVGLGIMGNGLHPSAEHPSNILEDEVAPMEDIRHNQWIPSTPSYNNIYYRRQKTLRN